MTKKLFASLVCAFGFLLLGAHPASAGSVSTSAYAEADALTNCINTGSTSAFCDVGFAQAFVTVGAGGIFLSAFAIPSQFLGGQSAGFASGSINDLLTFTDGSLTGPAFVEFSFGVQISESSNSCQTLDATAGNQVVPLSSLSYDNFGIANFATTPQAMAFGSPLAFSRMFLCSMPMATRSWEFRSLPVPARITRSIRETSPLNQPACHCSRPAFWAFSP